MRWKKFMTGNSKAMTGIFIFPFLMQHMAFRDSGFNLQELCTNEYLSFIMLSMQQEVNLINTQTCGKYY